jgi:predicted O-linked N-acetylglucosamine transferase (SPINDLY family)
MQPGADIAAPLALHREGRLAEAECGYRTLLRQRPRDAEALHLLGLLIHQRGDDAAAAALIRQAIGIAPRMATYHANLGIVLLRLRRADEAVSALRTALRLHPADFASQANLGVALGACGDHDGAVKAAGAALRLRPGDPATLCNRGHALAASGQIAQALAAFDAALQADPRGYAARIARGTTLLSMGRVPQALAAFDAAIACDGGDERARQARIVALNYLPGATMRMIGETARRLAHPANLPQPAPFAGLDRRADRVLRIGYVSADFRNHPVGYFLRGVLAARDRTASTVICYDNGTDPDAMTAALRTTVDDWRPIAGRDDDQVAAAIRADRIDILVDLAGHTKGNRLGVFARRAAPVQAAWLGYFGTTGLAAMDAVIADRHVLPPADEATVSERVIRLPDSYLCFSPPEAAGPVMPLPAGMDRPITFGCFNNRAKLAPPVLALWARVLAAVPRSRLLLKSAQYTDKTIRQEIAQSFAALGIPSGRVAFEPASPLAALFDAYGRVDIALDTVPFAGGATTAQALWMGVPVVSLVGDTWPGRQGASLLSAAGFAHWAAADADGYVAIAQGLAADRPRLATLRAGLRTAIAASPLCQADRFDLHLQSAWLQLWHAYLAESAGPGGLRAAADGYR